MSNRIALTLRFNRNELALLTQVSIMLGSKDTKRVSKQILLNAASTIYKSEIDRKNKELENARQDAKGDVEDVATQAIDSGAQEQKEV